jgi:hypothetical protein
MMKKHMIWMLIGCVVPLLLIFMAPGFGLDNSVSFFVFILLMFGAHLMMLRAYHKNDHEDSL